MRQQERTVKKSTIEEETAENVRKEDIKKNPLILEEQSFCLAPFFVSKQL